MIKSSDSRVTIQCDNVNCRETIRIPLVPDGNGKWLDSHVEKALLGYGWRPIGDPTEMWECQSCTGEEQDIGVIFSLSLVSAGEVPRDPEHFLNNN